MGLRSFMSILFLIAFLSTCFASSSKVAKKKEDLEIVDITTIDELINQRLQSIIDDIIANITVLNGEMDDVQGYLSELDVKVELKTNENAEQIDVNAKTLETYGFNIEAIEEIISEEVDERMGNDTILSSMVAKEVMDRADAISKEVDNRIKSEKEIQAELDILDKLPIGTILSLWTNDVIPYRWVACNGQDITEGPLTGQKAPDLNTGKKFLRGSEEPGTMEDANLELNGIEFVAKTNEGYEYYDNYLDESGSEYFHSCGGYKAHNIWGDDDEFNADERSCSEHRPLPQMDVSIQIVNQDQFTETRPINMGVFFVLKVL